MRQGKEESKYKMAYEWICHSLTREEAGSVTQSIPKKGHMKPQYFRKVSERRRNEKFFS